ncbi:transcriptional regulator containing PAS, AAA-type ATPase, and DNA-binding domains [Desulfosporosinus orientis DSM 765]|uniref:Transcriptional regulator containing PAS, AAA-type ATPase, and DNA-binding domains n=2 Tax=Desulfosporosinus orientis TaxID=1563 RepID=G7WDA5_DESOD|nr:transcriptional regulator containing PAS, AAA-type ATPase, and DNA-binding domains [Desulfosporosinus orientis DSM 765]
MPEFIKSGGRDLESAKVGIKQYHELSQKVAEAIKAVLDIDVTIMNESLERIAGTGKYKASVNSRIEKNTVFDLCLRTGSSQVVTERGQENEACSQCQRLSFCSEKAEICVPIKQGEEICGVLGAIAFDDEQKERIANAEFNYLAFLEKMAELLAAKYSECQMNIEKQVLANRLNGILNSINAGVVLYGENGDVLYKNGAIIKILKEIDIDNIDDFILEIRKNERLQCLLENKKCIQPCEIIIDIRDVKYTLLAAITHLGIEEASHEVILTVQNINRFRKEIIQSIEKNQVKLQFDNILGISDCFREAKQLAEKAAFTDSNILILGESGTGKELFARAIHNHSSRKEQAFVPINCGAIPDELLESELFGYDKGAFTGAFANKIGKFEVADNGTIFLDEISEMPYRLQVKLLRVLQEKEICRIGSNVIRKVDIKIVAASNVDLLKRIEDGVFRKDLYYRLNIIPINIPSLRERGEDIVYLANHFVSYYAHMLKKDIGGISEEVLKLFSGYSWPGNVRELQSIIEYAVNFETGKVIGTELIKKRLKFSSDKNSCTGRFVKKSLEAAMKETEREIIKNSIYENRSAGSKEGVVQKVCNDLEISRATLYRKMKELKIELNG